MPKTNKTCGSCGARVRTTTETQPYEPYPGLIVHLAAMRVIRCPRCARRDCDIPNYHELDHRIAAVLIRHPARLNGHQVRFLRRQLADDRGYIPNGTDLAALMGVDKATVTRWETGAKPIGPQADRLLRLMVAQRRHDSAYSISTFTDIDDTTRPPTTLHATFTGNRWTVALR